MAIIPLPPTQPVVVLDPGSLDFKAGSSSADAPRVTIDSLVGQPRRRQGELVPLGAKCNYVGDEASGTGKSIIWRAPIERRTVVHWDDLEALYQHVLYRELLLSPEEHDMIVTENTNSNSREREKLTQIMFETFNVPRFYAKSGAALSMYTSGHVTGLAIDCGYEVCHAVPVYEGHALAHASKEVLVGGRTITELLMRSLVEQPNRDCRRMHATRDTYISLLPADIVSIIQAYIRFENDCSHLFNRKFFTSLFASIKHKHAYVALDYSSELLQPPDSFKRSYELPDGKHLLLDTERFQFPEALFQPQLFSSIPPTPNLVDAATTAIECCDEQLKSDLRACVLLAGGGSLLPGLKERLEKELLVIHPTFKVLGSPTRRYAPWIGAAMFASLSTFQGQCITMTDYDENGPRVIHRFCY